MIFNQSFHYNITNILLICATLLSFSSVDRSIETAHDINRPSFGGTKSKTTSKNSSSSNRDFDV